GALPRIPSDHLGNGGGIEVRIARILALRREGEVEVETGAQARELLEDRLHHVFGRARIRRALEDDELPGAEVRSDRARLLLDVRPVRLAVGVERSRPAAAAAVRRRRLGAIRLL